MQAYLLLSLWGCGAAERYEQDKTWLLLGIAIRFDLSSFLVADQLISSISVLRMAVDLNLHRKTAVASQDTEEGKARDLEVHNRERTWILCYCLDRSLSAQMGKPHSIKEEYVANATQVPRLTMGIVLLFAMPRSGVKLRLLSLRMVCLQHIAYVFPLGENSIGTTRGLMVNGRNYNVFSRDVWISCILVRKQHPGCMCIAITCLSSKPSKRRS